MCDEMNITETKTHKYFNKKLCRVLLSLSLCCLSLSLCCHDPTQGLLGLFSTAAPDTFFSPPSPPPPSPPPRILEKNAEVQAYTTKPKGFQA
jgi:hypothetical protein